MTTPLGGLLGMGGMGGLGSPPAGVPAPGGSSGIAAASAGLPSLLSMIAAVDAPQMNPEQPVLTKEQAEALVAWVEEKYRLIKNNRVNIERQWYINMAFYFGRQNVQTIRSAASITGYQLYTPPTVPWRVRLVVNKIRPYIRTELSKVCSQRPRFTVVPSTTEDEDQVAARVAEQIFDSLYTRKNFKRVIRKAEWWNLLCGNAYFKCYWDSEAVDPISKSIGDICVEPVDPFHLFVPDFKTEDIEQQPYVIHATMKSEQWVKNSFGPTFQTNYQTKGTDDILEDSFLNLMGVQNPVKDQILCLECWLKPGAHDFFPQGGMVTIVGGALAQTQMQFPYSHGEFPFAKLENVESGKFYSDSMIVDMIPLQREYNRRRSIIIESANRMGKPQLIAPRGSVDGTKITTEPGQVIYYTPGFNPPQPLALQALPSYILEEIQQLQQDMDDIAGQHEIARGGNPSQVTAASALSFLSEQDDTKLAGTVESLELAIEKVGRQCLSYVSQFWDVPRLVKVMGSDGSFDAQTYKGADLGGNNDVRVEAGSALPRSKAAKQAFLMDLMKMGLIPAQQGLEMLEIGNIEKIYDDYLADLHQAQRENLKMQEGLAVTVNDWDNHELHIQIHNKYRKQQTYEMLDDNTRQLWQQHVEMHQAVVQQNMMQQMMMQMGAAGQGQPGASGQEPPGIPDGPPGPEQGPPGPPMGG